MPTSTKPKSPRGESGPGDSKQLPEEKTSQLPKATVDCENPHIPEIPDPVPVAAPVAADSVDNADIPSLTPSERKLADRMTRDIAQHLGLSGRSRSVRI